MFKLWQNWPLQARMLCPTPKYKLKAPAYQPGKCAGNSKSLQQRECLKFTEVMVCEIPLDVVSDKSASVSCLSPPKVFVRLSRKIHSSPRLCSKRLLAADQGEIRVKGEVTVEMKIAPMTFRHPFLSLKLLKLRVY